MQYKSEVQRSTEMLKQVLFFETGQEHFASVILVGVSMANQLANILHIICKFQLLQKGKSDQEKNMQLLVSSCYCPKC